MTKVISIRTQLVDIVLKKMQIMNKVTRISNPGNQCQINN